MFAKTLAKSGATLTVLLLLVLLFLTKTGEIKMGDFDGALYYDTRTNSVNQVLDGSNGLQGSAPASATGSFSINDPSTGQVLGASTGSAPASDPYEQWGGRGSYDALRSKYSTQKQGILGSVNQRIGNEGKNLRSGILDYVDQLRSKQSQIDNTAINNELARDQGTADIYGMVSQGIQSGGNMLSNKNASDSSASGALDKAYAQLGGRQMSKVGTQYEAEDRNIGLEQQQLDQSRGIQKRKLDEDQDRIVSAITTEVQQSLAALDAEIAGASLPDRIAIEQEKQAIRQRALSQLGEYDSFLQNQAGAVQATSRAQRMAAAKGMQRQGETAQNPFNYNASADSGFQGSAGSPSDLPLFTFNNRQRRGV